MMVKHTAMRTGMLLIAAVYGILAAWAAVHYHADLERLAAEKAGAAGALLQEAVADQGSLLRAELAALLEGTPGIGVALARKDREEVSRLVEPVLERLRARYTQFRELNVYLPQGGLLRAFGEGGSAAQAGPSRASMLVHVIRKAVAGHEVRSGSLLHLVALPVLTPQGYAGAVELGFDTAGLARRLESAAGARLAWIREPAALANTPAPGGSLRLLSEGALLNPLGEGDLFVRLLQGREPDRLPQRRSLAGREYSLNGGGRLADATGAQAARLLLALDVTREVEDLHGSALRSLALGLGFLAVACLAFHRGFGSTVQRMERINRRLAGKIGERTRVLGELSEKLRHSNRELDQIFNSAADGMRIVDRNFNVLRVNDTFMAMARVDRAAAEGGKCYETFRCVLCLTPECPLIRLQSGQDRIEVDVEKARQDGSMVSCILTASPFRGQRGELLGIIEDFKDITVRKATLRALRASEERYRTVADHIYDWESWVSPEGRPLFVSPACERITGHPPARFITEPGFIERIIHPEDLDLWQRHMAVGARGEGQPLDFRIITPCGTVRWVSQEWRAVCDDDGRDLGIRTSIRDITDRKHMEQKLAHQALHDPLTGLANRNLCLERIQRAIQRASRRRNYQFAVVFVDLDRFKSINDGFGHSCGDNLLMEFSQRMSGIVRSLDTLARFGGDEFVILLEELASLRETIRFVKRVRASLAAPFTVQGYEVRLTASFGIAFAGNEDEQPEELLHKANIAMHRAKEMGRDQIKVFNSRMLEQAILYMTLENDMRRALDRDEFRLVYQPIYSLREHRLVGFEALLRWDHPGRTFTDPGEFIPLAEETGLILDLGKWALREACDTLSRWREAYPAAEDLKMSVNISARQFTQADLVPCIAHILAETRIPANRLRLEITETAIMDNAAAAVDKLLRLKGLGITISVDDFGTGYSSMAYLQRFPLDILKIDLSFVSRIESAPENQLIVKAIISLAHSLGLQVVAEGIEKEEHREHLTALECEFGQGFFFSHPLPRREAEALVANGRHHRGLSALGPREAGSDRPRLRAARGVEPSAAAGHLP